jgi:hypothetical protein
MTLRPAIVPDPSKLSTAPSLCIRGESGSGKTHSVGVLAEAGYKVAVLDIEGRTEAIQKYRPLIQPVTTRAEVLEFIDLMMCPDDRRRYVKSFRPDWSDLDIVAIDSLLEYESLLDTDMRVKFPSKSGDGSYARWDAYGLDLISLFARVRDIASSKNPSPVGVIVTAGEFRTVTRTGDTMFEIPIRGTQAPPRLPFYFSCVFRLESIVEESKAQWIMTTAGPGLKGPGTDILPARATLQRDSFVRVWERLNTYYRGEKQ